MNIVHIIGNLTNDPETRTVDTGEGRPGTVCSFSVAVNRYVHQTKVAEYFHVSVWGNTAENAAKYLSKGKKVAVTGAVTANAYIGRDGKAHASLEIARVQNIEFLSTKQDNENAKDTANPAANQSEPSGVFTPVEDEDLPF